MTEINDPGAPRTDELARNAALHALESISDDRSAHSIVGEHTVTWERDVNSAGVPVRRYVLRGAWEVDPETPAIETRDVVRYRDRRDGGREWTVGSAETSRQGIVIVSMTATGLDEMAEHRYARAGELEVVRKAPR